MQRSILEKTRPIIGITGPSSFTSDCVSTIENLFVANPVKLDHEVWGNVETWLKVCDAVILAGGVDIHPKTYGDSIPVGKNMRSFDARRDDRESKIIDWCLSHDIPMLGICRGHQLLGIKQVGLSLLQDICADATIVHSTSRQESKMELDIFNPSHIVEIQDGSEYPGPSTLFVNSFHHQGLAFDKNKLKGLDAIGVANVDEKSRIIELMVCKDENWMSVQWHPEWDWSAQESSADVLRYFRDHFLMAQTQAKGHRSNSSTKTG